MSDPLLPDQDYCQVDVGCILVNGHEGACDLRAALPPEDETPPPLLDAHGRLTKEAATGLFQALAPEPPREPTIRELAEIDALTLPPHERPAAIERMVAERRSAAVQRAIAEVMEGEAMAWRPRVRVEIPANLRPQETNVFVDNVRLGSVVAVRLQTRPNGERDAYVVLRVRDAEVKMAEGFADLEFGRLDLAVRQVRGFDVGTSMDSRQPVGMDYARRQLDEG